MTTLLMLFGLSCTTLVIVSTNTACLSPLGMKSGTIASDQIDVSDQDETYTSMYIRLDSAAAWCSSPHLHSSSSNPWITITLERKTMVKGIITQGITGETHYNKWFPEFIIEYRNMNQNVFEFSEPFVRDGVDAYTHMFHNPIQMSSITLRFSRQKQPSCMRLELLGCKDNIPCTEQLGLEFGEITNEQIDFCNPGENTTMNVRLNSRTGWCGSLNGYSWIQVNFNTTKKLTGIITQGMFRSNKWVTGYSVYYLLGNYWRYVGNETLCVFTANNDSETPVTNLFPSVVYADSVIIHIKSWNEWPCLRFDVLGCSEFNVSNPLMDAVPFWPTYLDETFGLLAWLNEIEEFKADSAHSTSTVGQNTLKQKDIVTDSTPYSDAESVYTAPTAYSEYDEFFPCIVNNTMMMLIIDYFRPKMVTSYGTMYGNTVDGFMMRNDDMSLNSTVTSKKWTSNPLPKASPTPGIGGAEHFTISETNIRELDNSTNENEDRTVTNNTQGKNNITTTWIEFESYSEYQTTSESAIQVSTEFSDKSRRPTTNSSEDQNEWLSKKTTVSVSTDYDGIYGTKTASIYKESSSSAVNNEHAAEKSTVLPVSADTTVDGQSSNGENNGVTAVSNIDVCTSDQLIENIMSTTGTTDVPIDCKITGESVAKSSATIDTVLLDKLQQSPDGYVSFKSHGVQVVATYITEDNADVDLPTTSGDYISISFTTFRLPGNSSVVMSYAKPDLEEKVHFHSSHGEEYAIASGVITITVYNSGVEVNEPVEFQVPRSTLRNSSTTIHVCAFYDLEQSHWSLHGCETDSSHSDVIQCSCNHMTSFAILMQVSSKSISKIHTDITEVITKVGLSLSLFSLLLTFGIYVTLPVLWKSLRNNIHKNLVGNMIVFYITFLFGIENVKHKGLCRFTAILMHFELQNVIVWMSAEAIYLVFKVVCRTPSKYNKLRYYLITCYFVSFLMVCLTIAVKWECYGTPDACYLERSCRWTVVFPSMIIVLFNTGVMLKMVYIIYSRAGSLVKKAAVTDKDKQIRSAVKGSVVLLPVLGITWIYGPFVGEDLVSTYLFVILNSIQGVLIFIVYCLYDKEVHEAFKKFRKRRIMKNRVNASFTETEANSSSLFKTAAGTSTSFL